MGWYLEWSTIARNVIHNRNLLRALGFLGTNGAPIEDESGEQDSIPVGGGGASLGGGAPAIGG